MNHLMITCSIQSNQLTIKSYPNEINSYPYQIDTHGGRTSTNRVKITGHRERSSADNAAVGTFITATNNDEEGEELSKNRKREKGGKTADSARRRRFQTTTTIRQEFPAEQQRSFPPSLLSFSSVLPHRYTATEDRSCACLAGSLSPFAAVCRRLPPFGPVCRRLPPCAAVLTTLTAVSSSRQRTGHHSSSTSSSSCRTQQQPQKQQLDAATWQVPVIRLRWQDDHLSRDWDRDGGGHDYEILGSRPALENGRGYLRTAGGAAAIRVWRKRADVLTTDQRDDTCQKDDDAGRQRGFGGINDEIQYVDGVGIEEEKCVTRAAGAAGVVKGRHVVGGGQEKAQHTWLSSRQRSPRRVSGPKRGRSFMTSGHVASSRRQARVVSTDWSGSGRVSVPGHVSTSTTHVHSLLGVGDLAAAPQRETGHVSLSSSWKERSGSRDLMMIGTRMRQDGRGRDEEEQEGRGGGRGSETVVDAYDGPSVSIRPKAAIAMEMRNDDEVEEPGPLDTKIAMTTTKTTTTTGLFVVCKDDAKQQGGPAVDCHVEEMEMDWQMGDRDRVAASTGAAALLAVPTSSSWPRGHHACFAPESGYDDNRGAAVDDDKDDDDDDDEEEEEEENDDDMVRMMEEMRSSGYGGGECRAERDDVDNGRASVATTTSPSSNGVPRGERRREEMEQEEEGGEKERRRGEREGGREGEGEREGSVREIGTALETRPGTSSWGEQPPVLLFDVMDTLVRDPYYEDMPRFFGMPMQQLQEAKHPTAWIEFEKGLITEEELFRKFFKDGRPVDVQGLKRCVYQGYEWLDGCEGILQRLKGLGYCMHALSNYPIWYQMIDEKLQLSRYLEWTFVSCRTGVLKPDAKAYHDAAVTLGLLPSQCIFVDDRRKNVEAAIQVGMAGILFRSSVQLEEDLCRLGVSISQ
ncbi:hypothetical protein CBR_g54655 [Chara braunii]|uniref:Uncharacterized protein n=1 Tax=Chara braunii TaxID=69332 RepID=A0A388MCB8_CHABU|nr:hypothetical protein CBR_g54655 [Chara braunii]|eukprot:GBG92210.1 hypothetical protein CBR_g54655 [Chara braunii]